VPLTPLQVLEVDVVPARPTEADTKFITHSRSTTRRELEPVAYIVRLRLQSQPEPTGAGWALFVGDLRIPKYWEYPEGIYFKVYDPGFFDEHADRPVRFSADHGQTFEETGLTLGRPGRPEAATGRTTNLPEQTDVLLGTASTPPPGRR
jgi:hypothetical protein